MGWGVARTGPKGHGNARGGGERRVCLDIRADARAEGEVPAPALPAPPPNIALGGIKCCSMPWTGQPNDSRNRLTMNPGTQTCIHGSSSPCNLPISTPHECWLAE